MAYAKLYDVGPDGAIELPHRLISPVRVTDVTKPVTIELPGIVHRFAGATGSSSSSPAATWPTGTRGAQPVTLTTGPGHASS